MNQRRKRIAYRPSKGESVFAGVVGVIFVLLGLFVAIPTFGAFGILWTLVAAGIAGMRLYQAFRISARRSELRTTARRGKPHSLQFQQTMWRRA